jgi:hypothetical protein
MIVPLHIPIPMALGNCNPRGCATEDHAFNHGMVVEVG